MRLAKNSCAGLGIGPPRPRPGKPWNIKFFKTAQEKELVPAILAGEREKADKIGTGIQKVRLDRIYALIDAIEK